ncbi:hypothetical protein JSE7799_00565 [Jannaschia seosinensis]|uniref:DUF4112 domain-containing protein n=1 Tax=Jannaschia seosinensis TaxID=313367 RepID=A0A0M7B957_9RHOB|nr:DUF4112 domain-containing protein [Jannaschia seosinensis]CUH21606.1 hypothetical protein JSE7799_00565 [Jannaschia seosinensis]
MTARPATPAAASDPVHGTNDPFDPLDPGTRAAAAMPGLSPEEARILDQLDKLAFNLDSRYRVPGTRIRFGWDSIIGLVPGLGDTVTLIPAAYILVQSHKLGTPNSVKGRMVFNAGLDWVVGSIPLVGDLFDVGLKANRRNVALLRRHLEKRAGVTRV